MIGSFLSRGLVMLFGYAYPAYECYKTVEKNKPDIEQLLFWCQYWILVALLTVFERLCDAFISWLPMYNEAKLAFIIYLWYPKTKGSKYIYDSFFKPYVAKHESEIDRNLLELRTRAGDMIYMYCYQVVNFGQTRIFDVLQYIAAQSTPKPRPAKPQQQAPREQKPPPVSVPPQPSSKPQQAATPPQPPAEDEEPPSPTLSNSSSNSSQQDTKGVEDQQKPTNSSTQQEEPSPSPSPLVSSALAVTPSSPLKKSVSVPASPKSPSNKPATNNGLETKQIKPSPSKVEKPMIRKVASSPQETVMEDAIQVTRGRLRKTRSTVTK